MLKLYFANDDERSEWESMESGFRCDLLVEIDGEYYQPDVVTIERLAFEFHDCIKKYGVYEYMDPCTILVEEVSKTCIIKTVIRLHEQDFFRRCLPVSLSRHQNSFPELTDIRNWVKIYES